MKIILYSVVDNDHTIPKHLTNQLEITGTLRSENDLLNTSFMIEMSLTNLYNYAYIPDFGRYYYLSAPVTIRTGLVEYSGKVDVLQSWYTQFVQCPVIIGRSDSAYNTYINDSSRPFYQYTSKQYVTLGDLGVPNSIILVSVG